MSELNFELVVPAYNESKNLSLLIEKTVEAAKASGFTAQSFQLVVVNNGSLDDSAQTLQKLSQSHVGPWFRIVNVVQNQGYGFGLESGLKATKAPVIGWSHADLQCDPANAFKAYSILKQRDPKTLIKGERFGRNWKDILVSRVFEALAFLILGVHVREMNAQPKVFSRALLEQLKNPPRTFAFDLYVLYCARKAGYNIETIQVLFPPRIHGVSNWASNLLSRYKTIWGIIKYMVTLARTEGRV